MGILGKVEEVIKVSEGVSADPLGEVWVGRITKISGSKVLNLLVRCKLSEIWSYEGLKGWRVE